MVEEIHKTRMALKRKVAWEVRHVKNQGTRGAARLELRGLGKYLGIVPSSRQADKTRSRAKERALPLNMIKGSRHLSTVCWFHHTWSNVDRIVQKGENIM